MNTVSLPTDAEPPAIVADFECRARRFETPCGNGSLVWRTWGSGPPVLLAHGGHGAWSHWIRNIDALARELNKSAARLDASIIMLTDERNRSAAILGSMIEGVAVIGEDERVIFSNRAFSQILGLAELGEIEGRPLLEVARQSDLLAAIRMALSGHQQVTSEIQVRSK